MSPFIIKGETSKLKGRRGGEILELEMVRARAREERNGHLTLALLQIRKIKRNQSHLRHETHHNKVDSNGILPTLKIERVK